MVNKLLKEEIKDKLVKHIDNSYVIISIGELRELVPELICFMEEPKKISPPKEELKEEEPKEINTIDPDEIITIAELHKRLIRAALEKTNGNVEKAAYELGISERNLYRKLNEYGINHNKYKKKC